MGPEGGAPETGKEERSSYLEEETAAHSSVLAWRIPGTQEPGGLPSVELDMTEVTQQQLVFMEDHPVPDALNASWMASPHGRSVS